MSKAKENFFQHLVYPKLRLVYCPIPKVACSSIKTWLLKAYGVDTVDMGMCHHQYSLKNFDQYEEDVPLKGIDGFHKVVFVRNPWDRLVSAYLDKFVMRIGQGVLASVRDIIFAVQNKFGRPESVEDGITFREFVDYLWKQGNCAQDDHWIPQFLFVESLPFDQILRFENLVADVRALAQILKTSVPLPVVNALPRGEGSPDTGPDTPCQRLRQIGNFPDYRKFYDAILRRRVGLLYAGDVSYGYTFE